jgi:hypothetical protein
MVKKSQGESIISTTSFLSILWDVKLTQSGDVLKIQCNAVSGRLRDGENLQIYEYLGARR